PGRDLRLGQGAALETAALPQGDRRVRRAAPLPDRGGAEPRAPARGRRADLRPRARDVRGAQWLTGSSRVRLASAGPSGARTEDTAPRSVRRRQACGGGLPVSHLLVTGAEPGEELGVVAGGDDRVRVLALEQLQLLQRAAEVVGVVGARRQRRVALELGSGVGGVAA